ncbi:MAG: xanthine dehydrogenase family protein molybdopterin-binding subunit [Alphaproteobacteria bacterium]|jgi:CO/xanthine dehydrogenase Mo-binding subunit|nr:xanthine dehydrogenase family protein molybdopterin-binding subunit [Alphaproteobacteria bacterium]MDP6515371.1 xanthine dehydrogenase family protein molybdopterin-binding subunit [Alphaproteobacteria bacterium]
MAKQKKEYKWVGKRTIRPDGADKVTGRAKFGADIALPGMLVGKVLRSPHAHARILSIDTDKAAKTPGVKAVVTSADMPEMPSEFLPAGEMQVNFRDMSCNIMARDKALYDGHAVAAVAATSAAIADEALALIEVKYEVLPHVIDVVEAMKPDAPILHDDLFTDGVSPKPDKPSNIAKWVEFALGDTGAGLAEAEVVVEREYTTKPVHQGYIEPHAAVADVSEDGQTHIWCSSQGHFMVRAYCAKLLEMDIAKVRVTPAEIGGGFGGKTVVYVEPLAVLLSRKAGRPVKIVMTRRDVFRASGPAAGSVIKVKLGAKKDGTITAAEATLLFQAGAFQGSPVGPGCMTAFAPFDLENVKIEGFDVVCNRPKVAAYRAPGAPNAAFGVECALDELAKTLGMDPVALRAKNAAREGTKAAYGVSFGPIGYVETLDAVRDHPHYQAPLGPNQGRGVATGFWFNIGGESSASVNIGEDGTATVITGSPDIGGSRASMAQMVAEELGIDIDKVRPIVADTGAIGYSFLTGGSRVTFATGMAAVQAARDAIGQLRDRAAKVMEVPVENVVWEEGYARVIGDNADGKKAMSLEQLSGMATQLGGPVAGHASINAKGAGPGFGAHICDVEVDRETGRVTILRYTAVQDVGRAIHPGYVEGQLQGGVAQGVGWALNEEYIYDEDGRLANPGYLDYRIPVASDLPMIDTVLVEVPNPKHPYGVRGVGEVPIVPPMAAVANAIENAIGIRMTDLPMSPPHVLAALDGGS